jgi:MFS family permease
MRWLDILGNLRDGRVTRVVLVNFVAFAAVQGLLLSTLVYVIRNRHFTMGTMSVETASGLALALLLAAGAVSVLWTGRRADRVKTRTTLAIWGLFVMIPGYLLLATTYQLSGLVLGLLLVGVGMGMVNVPLLALIGDFVSRERRGSAVGVLQLFGDVGGVLGPLIGTPLVLGVGARLSYGAMTVLIAGGVVIAVQLLRIERRASALRAT